MATTTSPTPGPELSPERIADDELAGELRISVMRLARRLRIEKTDESLTFSQLSALATLFHHGPLSPTALAEAERVQPPSMTRIIAILEARGLTLRVAHPSDRRQSVIEISDAGRLVIEENRKRRTAWLVGALADLNDDERLALHRAAPLLERLARE